MKSSTTTTATTSVNEQVSIESQLNNFLLQEKIQKSPTTTPISTITKTTNTNEQQQTADILNAILLKGKTK